ncbi:MULTISPECIES: hypothetical protein [Catellatospora]|uniref:Uncharacterized protein n=1 Tax=Catellatospora chokoriensis TaxID=310353 RepID=A0A8J3JMT5_9ACTN|nr:hypothetical protein [Catellatospora chokoriensis]GIF87831.1 hypothetical protein Cch02nite_12750 [Catellatospora chokoriensis]
MNTFKGIGACVVLAATIFVMGRLVHVEMVIHAVSLVLVAASTVAYLAALLRFRRDRRIAGD